MIPLFPNSSIAGIALAMGLLFLLPFFVKKYRRRVIVPVAGLLFILLILSQSRSGWLGLAAGICYITARYVPGWRRPRRIALVLATLSGLTATLLAFKKDSSAGRMHIYALSARIAADHWPQGTGMGRFSGLFNQYQADYFAGHSLVSRRALLADDTFYAFNDYLQWAAETGLAGVLALFITVGLIISHIRRLHRGGRQRLLVSGATAALLSLSVSAFFSYPLQVRSIQGLALLFLLLLAMVRMRGRLVIPFRVMVLLLVAGWARLAADDIIRARLEQTAFHWARQGYKQKALEAYDLLTQRFPRRGYNWYAYARQLYYAGRLAEARACLHHCLDYYAASAVYVLLADIETEAGRLSLAGQYRLRALYMVPNRMQSRADLAQHYLLTGDTAKARYWQQALLSMPVKVPSERTEQLIKETKRILNNISRKVAEAQR